MEPIDGTGESRRAWGPYRRAFSRSKAKEDARAMRGGAELPVKRSGERTSTISLLGRRAQVRGLPGEEEQHGVLRVIGPSDHGWR